MNDHKLSVGSSDGYFVEMVSLNRDFEAPFGVTLLVHTDSLLPNFSQIQETKTIENKLSFSVVVVRTKILIDLTFGGAY